MVVVSLFFSPWADPENVVEITRESETLDDSPLYGGSLVEAVECIKTELPVDSTFTVLRIVKEDGVLLEEMETEVLSTGRKYEDKIVREILPGVSEALKLIGIAAETFLELRGEQR